MLETSVLRWQQNRRVLWPATECHWSDTEGRRSCCAWKLGMPKRARMLMETCKTLVDPSAMTTQMREDSDFWSFPPLVWRTLLVKMDYTTSRLITFSWGSVSDQEWTQPEHEVFQKQTLELPRLADDDLLPSSDNQQAKTHKTQVWPRSQCVGKLPSYSEKFAPLTIMNNEDADMDSMITTLNTAVTETASEVLGKHRQKKKPWVFKLFHLLIKNKKSEASSCWKFS